MKNVWPFISFMLIVVLGFGHAMYILLKSPQEIGVEPDGNQYHIKSTDPNVNSLYNNVLIEQSFNLSNTNDNSFSNFAQSTKAVYFWINGRWDQLEQWDFWPVDVLSILASVLLVIVMQNMLIAFMTGVFDDAKAESRHAVLKYRAELIADYETLENPFGYTEKNPRHIFYIGNANKFAEWLRKCEEYRRLRNDTTATTNYSLSAKERVYLYDGDNDDCGGDDVVEFMEQKINNNKKADEDNKYLSNRQSNNYNGDNVNRRGYGKDGLFRSATIDNSSYLTPNHYQHPYQNEISNRSSPSSPSSPPPHENNNALTNVNFLEEIGHLKNEMKNIKGDINNRMNLIEEKISSVLELMTKINTNNNCSIEH